MLPPLFGNDRGLIVGAGNGAHGIEGIPEENRHEFHLLAELSSEQIAPSIALQFADAREGLGLQHRFIGVSVIRLRVAAPYSRDHATLLPWSYDALPQ